MAILCGLPRVRTPATPTATTSPWRTTAAAMPGTSSFLIMGPSNPEISFGGAAAARTVIGMRHRTPSSRFLIMGLLRIEQAVAHRQKFPATRLQTAANRVLVEQVRSVNDGDEDAGREKERAKDRMELARPQIRCEEVESRNQAAQGDRQQIPPEHILEQPDLMLDVFERLLDVRDQCSLGMRGVAPLAPPVEEEIPRRPCGPHADQQP